MQKKILIIFSILFVFSLQGKAQHTDTLIIMQARAIDGDTMLLYQLPEFEYTYYKKPVFTTRRANRRYTRLVKDLKKVYPYARDAGEKLKQFAPILDSLEGNKKAQDQYFNIIEDQLMASYGSELKKMNIRQGRLLIKLVDRECQLTSYDVVREFRGSISAFFWQGFARIWGYNLKAEYDPVSNDKNIEIVIRAIEKGEL